jgi:hypothetical protein
MGELEQLLGLFVAAVILAAAARRVGAPYPVFLALGGALLGFFPNAPTFTVPPELALALFVAPVLLDAAYDTSLRDLRDNWVPVISLVVFAVGFTTATRRHRGSRARTSDAMGSRDCARSGGRSARRRRGNCRALAFAAAPSPAHDR